MPRARYYALDRAPTVEELRYLISVSDLRFQSILLVMLSSGMRLGAWDSLTWGDIYPIEVDGKLVAARMKVYRADPEEYHTFITPEAFKTLQEYMDLRAHHGEKITKRSFLVRDRWDTPPNGGTPGNIERPERLSALGVERLWQRLLWRYGLRTEKQTRHEFSLHSVRKFFKTRAEQVMKPINVEILMGHSTGISDSYYRPTENMLLEDYLKAVPILTLSEADALRRVAQASQGQVEERIQSLEARLSRLQTLETQIQDAVGGSGASLGPPRTQDIQSRQEPPKKVVAAEKVELMIEKGWDPVMNLPNGKVVMKMLQAGSN